MKPKSAHKVLHELANRIIMQNVLFGRPTDCPLNPSKPNTKLAKNKVGAVIESLSPEDRESLKSLTSKEASDIRFPTPETIWK